MNATKAQRAEAYFDQQMHELAAARGSYIVSLEEWDQTVSRRTALFGVMFGVIAGLAIAGALL
jgi:hypothetical protein